MLRVQDILSIPPNERAQWLQEVSQEQLIEWVSEYAAMLERTKGYGKKYRLKQQHRSKLLAQFLDKDELEQIDRMVEQQLYRKEHIDE